MNKIDTFILNPRLSKTIQSIPPSGIRRFFDLASSMAGVISLGVGEPDFVTPWKMREASISALERGYTTYTANSGLPELKKEISKYLQREFRLDYNPEKEIVVTVGASEAIDIALRAILDPGDEVIVVEPSYVSYAPVVSLAGGIPVTVATDKTSSFKLTPEAFEEKISRRTKAVIFCYPNNPTGAIMTGKELERVAEIVVKHDLLVISDEIYAELTYDRKHDSFAAIKGMFDRTILISGFSKAFAMTGWRIGFAAGPPDVIQAMIKIHQYTILCAPIMGQMAAIEALKNGMREKDEMVNSYRQRRNYMVKALREIGLSTHEPEGAFYMFPSIESTGLTSEEFAEGLIMKEKVAVVPGNVFGQGGEGHIRCSYATSMEQLQEAVKRIKRYLDSL
ncbi:aminotransferase [Microaerobacter geothermalis]|uniref:aminotransferase n=1 Tax=Microaerobacter geothermalis TaxID=674972 RepID=UPI001F2E8871|nr:aminotransferase [Microaerobacter geothermalis]MCF6092475.1 aminotransferase [Microaerobacter geothermalis]